MAVKFLMLEYAKTNTEFAVFRLTLEDKRIVLLTLIKFQDWVIVKACDKKGGELFNIQEYEQYKYDMVTAIESHKKINSLLGV